MSHENRTQVASPRKPPPRSLVASQNLSAKQLEKNGKGRIRASESDSTYLRVSGRLHSSNHELQLMYHLLSEAMSEGMPVLTGSRIAVQSCLNLYECDRQKQSKAQDLKYN